MHVTAQETLPISSELCAAWLKTEMFCYSEAVSRKPVLLPSGLHTRYG